MLRNAPFSFKLMQPTADNMVTVTEFAGLALDVYNDKAHASPPIGWDRFYEDGHNIEGYFAACYVKMCVDQTIVIVIAHRGTANCENIISDVKLFFDDRHLLVVNRALAFTREAIQAVCQSEKYGKYSNHRLFFNTGHSLGAVISDAVSVKLDPKPLLTQTNIFSTTFENPGSKNYLMDYIPQGERQCTTFLSNPDMINTNNEQLGTVYRLTNLPFHYLSDSKFINFIGDIPDNLSIAHHLDELSYAHYLDNNYYVTIYTLDQHSILGIYEYLSNGGRVDLTINPCGFQEGYVSYLDPTRTTYWQGYTETCWQKFPHLQKEYPDLTAYQADFMRILSHTYQAAQSMIHPATQVKYEIVHESEEKHATSTLCQIA